MRLGVIVDRPAAARISQIYRDQRKKVVLTNGCFDLLHVGHVRLLEKAAALGNILFVGLNTDTSVRRLKGDGRPVVCEQDRAEVIAALRYVDHVVLFEEDTAESLVKELTPDIYVKGGDYDRGSLPEVPIVEGQRGQVLILPYTPNRSTTKMIQSARPAQDREPSGGT